MSVSELWIGTKRRRFELFRNAKLAYEDFFDQNGSKFQLLEPTSKELAITDRRLIDALTWYEEALELCLAEKAFRDAAVTLLQMGKLYRLWCRASEARALFERALEIADSLPSLNNSELGLLAQCCSHIGIVALLNGDAELGRRHIGRSVAILEFCFDAEANNLCLAAMELPMRHHKGC